jgi:hypothetical protein
LIEIGACRPSVTRSFVRLPTAGRVRPIDARFSEPNVNEYEHDV